MKYVYLRYISLIPLLAQYRPDNLIYYLTYICIHDRISFTNTIHIWFVMRLKQEE